MTQKVFQLFMATPTEAWYQLSKEEQDDLIAKQAESFNKAGAKNLVFADSAWSNEEWLFFGVNEYPDIESLQKHTTRLADIQWLRYLDTRVILGTESDQI